MKYLAISRRLARFRGSLTALVLVATLLPSTAVPAQTGTGTLEIATVDTASFPSISLTLTVSGPDGQPVGDLTAESFAVEEDAAPIDDFTVETVERPLLLAIIVDSAVSFDTSEGGLPRVEQVREAARWLVGPDYGRLTPADQVAVFAFRDQQPVRLIDFSDDHNAVIDRGIAQVSTAGNEVTGLIALLRQAVEETSTRQCDCDRALLVFSDGVDRSSEDEIAQVVQEATDAQLIIYTVGMGTGLAPNGQGYPLLARLADETGGQYVGYQPGREGEQDEMQAFLDLLVAGRQHYALTYTTDQYEGTPGVRVAVTTAGFTAEAAATFAVPPLPPQLTLTNLEDQQIVQGTVVVRPAITRTQRALERVEYWLDGTLVHTARSAPWEFEWDTRPYASSAAEADVHDLRVVACDIGGQCAQLSLIVGTRLPAAAPLASPSSSQSALLVISIVALVVSLGALALWIVLMSRGGMQLLRNVATEVRRRTRVWRQRTGSYGSAPATRQSLATLTVVSAAYRDQAFPIEEDVVFLGRDEERADIVLHWDEYISRRHAKIAREGDRFYIWDLDSANGTWVDEKRVSRSLSEGVELAEALPLQHGAIVRLGPDLRLRFDLPGTGGESPSPAAPAPERSDEPTVIVKPPEQGGEAAQPPANQPEAVAEQAAEPEQPPASEPAAAGQGSYPAMSEERNADHLEHSLDELFSGYTPPAPNGTDEAAPAGPAERQPPTAAEQAPAPEAVQQATEPPPVVVSEPP